MTFEAITVEVAKLTLAPGDVLVVQSEKILSFDICERIRHLIEPMLPGNKVLVISPQLEMSVLTKADIKARL